MFRSQARRVRDLPEHFSIFISDRDRALRFSALIASDEYRLGNLPNPAAVKNLKVQLVDDSSFSSGIRHFDLGDSPALIRLLGRSKDLDAAFRGEEVQDQGPVSSLVYSVANATEIVLSPFDGKTGPRHWTERGCRAREWR